MKMKVLHFSNYAPRRSGLYECTKDQIKYERKLGLDSQMAIYERKDPDVNWIDNEWLKPVSWDWAEQADLFVIHRGLPGEMEDKFPNKKKIMVIHGTSDFLILDEIESKAERTSFNTHINLINKCDFSVAVNTYDYDIYKLYDYNNKLTYIQDSIDCERFSLDGYKYPFMYHPQIIFCDSLRINKNPAHIIWAMKEVQERIPTARLTLVSLDLESILTWRNILLRSAKGLLKSLCENVLMEMTEIRPFLNGADILWNGNMSGIFSRVEMEAMACGCEIIGWDNKHTKWVPRSHDIKSIADQVVNCWDEIKDNREDARKKVSKYAFENFNMETNVKEKFIPLYNKILNINK
jgi:glycosyltransferase involved in cell wall biosynthesis